MKKRKGKIMIRGTLYHTSDMRAATVLLIPSLAFLIFIFVIPLSVGKTGGNEVSQKA